MVRLSERCTGHFSFLPASPLLFRSTAEPHKLRKAEGLGEKPDHGSGVLLHDWSQKSEAASKQDIFFLMDFYIYIELIL